MIHSRRDFIENLIDIVNEIISIIDDREILDADFVLVREITEQLRAEIEALNE